MKNKIKEQLIEGLKSFRVFLKNLTEKQWFNKWLLVKLLLVAVLIFVLINGIRDSLSVLNVLYLLCRDNIIIALCLLVTAIVLVYWNANRKFMTVASIMWGRVALFVLLISNIFLSFYRGYIDISSIEKNRLRVEYKTKLDSVKTYLRTKHQIKELEYKSEREEAKIKYGSLKQSFDSLVVINEAYQKKIVSLEGVNTSVKSINSDLDSLVSGFKKKLVVPTIPKVDVTPPKSKEKPTVKTKSGTTKAKKKPKKKVPTYRPPNKERLLEAMGYKN